MRKYINKKYISILLITIVATILLYNYFTCPRYLNPIELNTFFKESQTLYKQYKYNSVANYYSGPLGEVYFGFIAYIPILHTPTTPEDIRELRIIVKNAGEKTYKPLIKGFTITIEEVKLYVINETIPKLELYATTTPIQKKFSPDSLEISYLIHHKHHYLPRMLIVNINYTIHAIINPYIEGEFEKLHITAGFHLKVYSGITTTPITITPK